MVGFRLPVLFVIFNRPEMSQRSFSFIRTAKPNKLYIASDGARLDHPGEEEVVARTRSSVLAMIDWDCEVQTLFQEQNLGCGPGVYTAISWFFEHEEMGVVIEDDCIVSESFFPFMEQMLTRYATDQRIGMVAGFNAHLVNGIYGNNASGDKVQPQSVKAYIYIVVATLTKTDIEVDIDEVATDLNMLNHDLNKKVDKDSLIEIPVIVQSYRNGLSWYRIWSDGWCEQGGRFKTDSGSAGYKDVNLLIAMADTNFDVYITRGAESTTTNYNVWAQNPSYTRSTTTIKVYVSNISAYVYWRVCGKC